MDVDMDSNSPRRRLIWTTKDGVQHRVKDMTNGHLVNTVRFLQRKENFERHWRNDKVYKAMVAEIGFRGMVEDSKGTIVTEIIPHESEVMMIGITAVCVKCFKMVGPLGCPCGAVHGQTELSQVSP